MKQLSLLKEKHLGEHGGHLHLNKRKTRRPLANNKPIHLILKSQSILQVGGFKIHEQRIRSAISKYAGVYDIKIYEIAICSNHIHIALHHSNPALFKNFLRVCTGQIAFQLKQRNPSLKNAPLWDSRPYTKIIHWGKHLDHLLNYVEKNQLENLGWIKYQRS